MNKNTTYANNSPRYFVEWGLFGIASCITAFLPAIPDDITIQTGTFVLAAFVATISALLTPYRIAQRLIENKWIIAFYICTVIPQILISDSPSFESWARGFIPFFFISWLLLVPDTRNRDEILRVVAIMIWTTVLWGIYILATIIFEHGLSGLLESGRLTYLNQSLLIPYALIGACLSIFFPSGILGRFRWYLFTFFVFLIIMCGYRSQVALVFLILCYYMISTRNIKALLSMLVVIAIISIVFQGSIFIENIIQRSSSMEDEIGGYRYSENLFAINRFFESPIIGSGLGSEIPISTVVDLSYSELSAGGRGTVAYIHNWALYLLMDLGILGLVTYIAIFQRFLVTPYGIASESLKYDINLYGLIILPVQVLFIYNLVEASFRLIHVNIFLGTMLALASNTRHK